MNFHNKISIENSQGIVLRKFSIQENGVLIIVFSDRFGKIPLTDKFMKKKEIYGGKTDLYSHIEFSFLKNISRKYQNLLISENIDKYSHLYNNTYLCLLSSVFLEMIDISHQYFQKNTTVFRMIKQFLSQQDLEKKAIFLRFISYAIHLFQCIGYSLAEIDSNLIKNNKDLAILNNLHQEKKIISCLKSYPFDLFSLFQVVIDTFENKFQKKMKTIQFLKTQPDFFFSSF